MDFRSLRAVVVAICALAIVAGCGKSNPLGRKAVSGTVKIGDTPVQQGSINFDPLQPGGTSSGATITNGKYAIPEDKGLPAGKYRVRINAPEPGTGPKPGAMPGDPVPPAKELVPAEWTAKGETVEVGANRSYEFNFDIPKKN